MNKGVAHILPDWLIRARRGRARVSVCVRVCARVCVFWKRTGFIRPPYGLLLQRRASVGPQGEDALLWPLLTASFSQFPHKSRINKRVGVCEE